MIIDDPRPKKEKKKKTNPQRRCVLGKESKIEEPERGRSGGRSYGITVVIGRGDEFSEAWRRCRSRGGGSRSMFHQRCTERGRRERESVFYFIFVWVPRAK